MDPHDKKFFTLAVQTYKQGLENIMEAHDNLKDAINVCDEELQIPTLAVFNHYIDHLKEVHRIMAAEWQRRFGQLEIDLKRELQHESSLPANK